MKLGCLLLGKNSSRCPLNDMHRASWVVWKPGCDSSRLPTSYAIDTKQHVAGFQIAGLQVLRLEQQAEKR